MGAAAWLTQTKASGAARKAALTLYAGQLALNFAWSPLFFKQHWLDASLVGSAGARRDWGLAGGRGLGRGGGALSLAGAFTHGLWGCGAVCVCVCVCVCGGAGGGGSAGGVFWRRRRSLTPP